MTRPGLIHVLLVAAVLVLAACEAGPPPTTTPDAGAPTGSPGDGTPAPQPQGSTLAAVQSRGELICGVNGGLPGFSFLEEGTGEWSGFDVDYCRAIAAAIFGDPERVQFQPLTADDRSTALQTRQVDVLIRNTTWTITRDTQWGVFAPTTFYDGQGMMVRADSGVEELTDLEGATICVQSGTTTELTLPDQMRALGVDFTPAVRPDIDSTYNDYEAGNCDAVTSDRSQLVARRSLFENPDDHVLLDVVMSKEPLGPVVPFGDEQWFNIVKWVVFATFQAEELDIDSGNVAEIRDSSEDPVVRRLLGTEGELGALLGLDNEWAVNVISLVGNYEEIYNRNLGPETPFNLDRGPNQQWTDGGLLYSPPFR